VSFLVNPYTGAGGDPHFAGVVFLSGFEGGSVIDESPLAQTVTLTGSTVQSSAAAKFGTKSLYRAGDWSTGTTDKASVPNNAAFFTGMDLFTVEAWVDPASAVSNTTQRDLVAHYDNGAGLGWRLGFGSNRVQFTWDNSGDGNNVGGSWAPSNGTWYHIAADFDGTTLRIYLDGVLLEETTIYGGLDAITVPLTVGPRDGANSSMDAYIDEVRVTAGAARYATGSGFTLPSAAFPRA
jgi:hypothetical protein